MTNKQFLVDRQIINRMLSSSALWPAPESPVSRSKVQKLQVQDESSYFISAVTLLEKSPRQTIDELFTFVLRVGKFRAPTYCVYGTHSPPFAKYQSGRSADHPTDLKLR